ncbi:MAG: HD domain-containing protein, partial [Rhodobacteraceae bacterium]|nr:HD domain-containing protein [Paracoccaceae bacterium]
LDPALIISALLHDTIEDTDTRYSEIAGMFGREIADIVNGVTKLDRLRLSSSNDERQHNAQRLMLAVASDERVILVKLADRLHNMRTIQHMVHGKQRQKAKESLYFYAPVAAQLGLYRWREELEDLSFRVLNPDARKFVKSHIRNVVDSLIEGDLTGGGVVEEVRDRVQSNLELHGLKDVVVVTRIKRPYSVWRKMQRRSMSVGRIADILGVRIITSDDNDVYKALGIIHRKWIADFSRFKDYVSLPKVNGYRSVHTTITHKSGCQIEFQIRSKLMHEVAEYGIAAHWVHHQDGLVRNPYTIRQEWRAGLQELVSTDSPHWRKFYKAFRENTLARSVYCFAPNTDVIWLPKGATVLDFAYELDKDSGDHAKYAYIDMKKVQLNAPVIQGQTINLIKSTSPYADELKLKSATTAAARRMIGELQDELIRQKEVEQGTFYLKDTFFRYGETYTDATLRTAQDLLDSPSEEDLLRKIGRRELHPRRIIEMLYPNNPLKEYHDIEYPEHLITDLGAGEDMKLARCCQPVPHDHVIGIRGGKQSILIHLANCHSVDRRRKREKVRWTNGPFAAVHPTKIVIRMTNLPGVLGQVCTVIGEQKSNINDLILIGRKHDHFDFTIELEVEDREHLDAVMDAVKALDSTIKIDRYLEVFNKEGTWSDFGKT